MKRFMTKQNQTKARKKSSQYWKRTSCGLLATMLIVSSVALTGCGEKKDTTEEEKVEAIKVETVTPGTNSIQVLSDFIGTVEASEETSIIPKIAGEVTAKNFEVGDYVNAGDLLFTIDDTALQISKTTAEASVQMAQANLNTAQTGLVAQQASNAATKASVNETLGTMSTTEQQLENSVSSAKRGVGAAKGQNNIALESFQTYQDATSKASDKVDSADKEVSNTEHYLESLENIYGTYQTIKNKANATDAKAEAESHGVTVSSSIESDIGKIADAYVAQKTSYGSGENLYAAFSGAKSAYEGAKQTKKGLEGSHSQSLLAQIQSAIQSQITADSIKTAEEGLALAQKYKEDYENFTKNTITAGANAQIVGGDAQVITSQNSITTAEANLSSANAGLAGANLQLEYTQVKAPVSGVIQQINVEQYEMASNQSPAYVIASQDSKKITFYVAENAMKSMQPGQAVTIDKEGTTYDASITSIGSTVDAQKGLFKIETVLNGTEAGNFITGTSVKLTTATQQAIDVMTVPIDAVYYESQQAYVYLMKDGIATRTDITTGIADDKVVEVKEGLTSEDRVIATWEAQLKDGAAVEEAAKKEEATEETTEEATETTEATTEAAEETEAKGEPVETVDNVNIRAAATTDSEKVGMAVTGQKFNRLEETADGWSKIVFEGQDAYVKTEYLKAADQEASTEESTEATSTEITESSETSAEATSTETTEPAETATDDVANQEETVNE